MKTNTTIAYVCVALVPLLSGWSPMQCSRVKMGADPSPCGSSGGGWVGAPSMIPEPDMTCSSPESPNEFGLDETTPAGFTAAQVLEFAVGSFSADVTWEKNADVTGENGENAGRQWSHNMQEATTQLTLNVQPTGEKARLGAFPDDTGGSLECLAMDVRVDISTADGGLDETLETVLSLRSAELASFVVDLPLSDLEGSLELTDGHQPPDLGSLRLVVLLSPFGANGWIDGVAGTTDGCVTHSKVFLLAAWPDFDSFVSCGLDGGIAFTESTDEASDQRAQEVVSLIRDQSPLTFAWEDGETSTVTLDLALSHEPMCLLLQGDDANTLRVRTVAEATSTDVRFIALMPLAVELSGPTNESQTASEVRIQLDSAFHPRSSHSPEIEVSIDGIDLADYEPWELTFDWTLWIDGTTPVSSAGKMEIFGTSWEDCDLTAGDCSALDAKLAAATF